MITVRTITSAVSSIDIINPITDKSKNYSCINSEDKEYEPANPFSVTKSDVDFAENGTHKKNTKNTKNSKDKKNSRNERMRSTSEPNFMSERDRMDVNSGFERGLTEDQRLSKLQCVNLNYFNSFVRTVVRSTLVTTVIFMAVGIPQFGDMVDLVGGLVMPFTCFLLPSAMFIRLRHHLDRLPRIKNRNIPDNLNDTALTYKKKGYMSNIVYFKHVMIMIFGVMTMVGTTVESAAN